METGRQEIAGVIREIEGLGASLRSSRAFDFGCGVGRLCQALAEHFDQVWGVDISTRMIQRAKSINRCGDRVHYVLNDKDGLPSFGTGEMNLVYSNLVLQHMQPKLARGYLREFMRILAPGGMTVFQLPSHPATAGYAVRRMIRERTPRRLIKAYHEVRYGSWMRAEIYGIPEPEAIELLRGLGGEVLDVRPDQGAGEGWVSRKYYVRKRESS